MVKAIASPVSGRTDTPLRRPDARTGTHQQIPFIQTASPMVR